MKINSSAAEKKILAQVLSEHIVEMVGEQENAINKKALGIVECEVIPFRPIRTIDFEGTNSAVIAALNQRTYANIKNSVLKDVFFRLFGDISYKNWLWTFLLSTLTFFLASLLLHAQNPLISRVNVEQILWGSTLEFAWFLFALGVCGIAVNAIFREAQLPHRSFFQRTLLLTAALILFLEACILVSVSFSG